MTMAIAREGWHWLSSCAVKIEIAAETLLNLPLMRLQVCYAAAGIGGFSTEVIGTVSAIEGM
jgi:hypothetical protein